MVTFTSDHLVGAGTEQKEFTAFPSKDSYGGSSQVAAR